ncbi:MAG TPA: HAD-IC family P-type ATPase, partial [Acidobacteriota bacterium]|nr:HAD-IC family P-type ATPase [Acidobacteriota bacterium]
MVGDLGEPWALTAEQVLNTLEVTQDQGLADHQVQARRKQFGPNLLKRTRKRTAWEILVSQFKSLIILLLAAAAAVSLAFGEWVDSIAIGAVLIINTLIGFFTELKARRSMEALYRLGTVQSRALRNGKVTELSAEELVPGDIIELEGGDVITADLRLIDAANLQADESALTGESVPVAKDTHPLPKDVPLADRRNMAFKGTSITRGSGLGVVIATGMNTEIGKITQLVEEAEEERTPLERRLNDLGHRLVWVTLAIAVVVVVSGLMAGKDSLLMIKTGIALAVATIPEGLPIVATIALARGMLRMARKRALVTRLSAVETLGATNIICTDKTGTLTENRMTIVKVKTASNT